PVLMAGGDRGRIQRSEVEELVPRGPARDGAGAAHQDLDREHRDVEDEQARGEQARPAEDDADPAAVLGPGCLADAFGTLVADRRRAHAIGADRAATARAVHPRDDAGMPVAGLDVQAGRSPRRRLVGGPWVGHDPDGTTRAWKTLRSRWGSARGSTRGWARPRSSRGYARACGPARAPGEGRR